MLTRNGPASGARGRGFRFGLRFREGRGERNNRIRAPRLKYGDFERFRKVGPSTNTTHARSDKDERGSVWRSSVCDVRSLSWLERVRPGVATSRRTCSSDTSISCVRRACCGSIGPPVVLGFRSIGLLPAVAVLGSASASRAHGDHVQLLLLLLLLLVVLALLVLALLVVVLLVLLALATLVLVLVLNIAVVGGALAAAGPQPADLAVPGPRVPPPRANIRAAGVSAARHLPPHAALRGRLVVVA